MPSFVVLAAAQGLIALPLTRAALPSASPMAVSALAPAAGLMGAGWLAWLAARAGLADGAVAWWLATVALGALGSLALRTGTGRPRALSIRPVLAGQAVLLGAFAAMATVVAHAPAIRGTEKPMDMALLAAAAVSESMPPQNPWLSGAVLDGYYHLGHATAAGLIAAAGVPLEAGYNLVLAWFFAASAAGAFGVGAAAAGAAGAAPVRAGLATAALAVVAGNAAGAVGVAGHSGPLRDFDWFSPSRVVEGTINEFPAFSWLLGDLHAHLMAVPLTFLALALALQLLTGAGRAGGIPVAAAGATVGIAYAVSAWSAPVLGLLLALAVAAGADGHRRLRRLGGLVLAAGLTAAPFLLAFDAPTDGIDLARRTTAPAALLLSAGVPLLAATPVVALAALRLEVSRRVALAAGGLVVAAAALGPTVAVLLVSGAAVCALAAMRDGVPAGTRLLWVAAATGLTCLAVPELVLVRDAFAGGGLERMNTVFKLGHQAWLLLAVAGAGGLWAVLGRLTGGPRALGAAAAMTVAAVALAYPAAAVWARTDGFAGPAHLDGMRWLRAEMPGDAAAIEWLRANAAPDAVLAEAVGPDYSSAGHGRISTFTGRPAVLGWEGHVLQWGGDPGNRRAAIRRLYRTDDANAARRLLVRYGVDYVVVGALERATYGAAGEDKWPRLGTPVRAAGATTVWDVRRAAAATARGLTAG